MDKFIFSFIDEDREGIFRDLTSFEGKKIIDFLPSHKQYNNKLLNIAKKLCLSYQLNSRFHVPFQTFFYNLEAYNYHAEHTYHIFIPTSSIAKFTVSYLEKFKNIHNNVRLYAWVTDSMHANSPHMDLVRDKLFSSVWDKVLTYDRYDAEEFGFTYFGYTYYSSFDFVKPDKVSSDVYYIGFDKGGRDKVVHDVYTKLQYGGAVPRFDIVSKKSEGNSDIKYLRKKISYPEVVSRVKSSNCILEILQKNQKAQSIRYFEAIVYNKKLLTNNERVKELPYYDERYMKIFHDVNEIDVEWCKKHVDIEYNYRNDFSPIKIIESIEK